MGKLIVITLGPGSFQTGFPAVLLRIAEDGQIYYHELPASLPASPDLDDFYGKLKKFGVRPKMNGTYNPSSEGFKSILNPWLASGQFLTAWAKILTNCTSQDIIRVVLQLPDPDMAKLPWHLWDFLENYPLAEIAFSLPEYKEVKPQKSARTKAKILAILGDSTGIDLTKDEQELQQLSPETRFLPEKDRETIFGELRNSESWDILFFAGHSHSAAGTGVLRINKTDSVTIDELEYAVRGAVAKGLRLAIFNSCDGLGLAKTLAGWNVPQVIVMRFPIYDYVAQQFLKFFLESLVKGQIINNDRSYETTLYLAMREARENLQGLEKTYPLASWFPVMYDQSFAAGAAPTWKQLNRAPEPDRLYQALLRLNYTKQVRKFRNVVDHYPVGACLIHGEENSGQKWLLNRLIKLVPDATAAKVISVDLNRTARRYTPAALWGELGGRVGLATERKPPQIIDKVEQLCQTQRVVFIFDGFEKIPVECRLDLLQKFWQPLADRVRGIQGNSRLLMLFVDHGGSVEQWDGGFVEALNSEAPHIPVRLPKITQLGEQDLVSWLENALDELPVKLTNEPDKTIGDILESSEGGRHELVLDKICTLCDCNWYDWEKKWLKY